MLWAILGEIEKCINFTGVLFKSVFLKSAYVKKCGRFPYYTLLSISPGIYPWKDADCPRIFKKDLIVTFYVLNNNFLYSQVVFFHVLDNIVAFFSFSSWSLFLPFIFFFFRKSLISFTRLFTEFFFVFLTIIIYYFYIYKKIFFVSFKK